MAENYDIDFVIPWVNGNDPNWLAEFNRYAPSDKTLDARNIRYRDYDLLRYWFRGVEKFAPWVRRVHFITCGQKPDWLNLGAPKLQWVRHSDYIPAEYLPVFSANPIEDFMHRIEGLSEHFVYFNDDFFLTAPVKRGYFFRRRLPCDSAVMEVKSSGNLPMLAINFNNLNIINRHFRKRDVMRRYWRKWFSLRYGKHLWKNMSLLPWPKFCGFMNPHAPQPFLKSTFETVWQACPQELEATMRQRFRSPNDVNQWLFRHWALCSGNFAPTHPTKDRRCFDLTDNTAKEIASLIRKQAYKEIIINDSELEDFNAAMGKIRAAFDEILPEKSAFEV